MLGDGTVVVWGLHNLGLSSAQIIWLPCVSSSWKSQVSNLLAVCSCKRWLLRVGYCIMFAHFPQNKKPEWAPRQMLRTHRQMTDRPPSDHVKPGPEPSGFGEWIKTHSQLQTHSPSNSEHLMKDPNDLTWKQPPPHLHHPITSKVHIFFLAR